VLQTITTDAEEKVLRFLFKKTTVDSLTDAEVHGLTSWLQQEQTKDGETKATKMVAADRS